MERGPWRPFFVAATELGRFALFRRLSALFPGLFLLATRRRPATHAGTILQEIESRPGIHYDGLRKQLKLGNGVLAHHLHALERQRHIRRRQTGMHVRFYPMALRPPPDISLDPTASRILRVVQQQPGVSQSDAGRGLGLSRQLVHHHVRRLQEWGLVSVVREGRSSHLRPTQAVTGLRRCPSCRADHVWQQVPSQATCPSCHRPFQPRADRSTPAT